MIVQVLGFFLLITGAVLSFGAYEAISEGQIKTISQVLIPLIQISAGFGLIRSKSWSRYLVVSLSFFYLMLAFLVSQNILVLFDFLPLISLVKYVPNVLLQLNQTTLSIIFFLLLPVT